MSKYAPDLAKHKFYRWLNTYHWVPIIVLGMTLLVIGGLPLMMWGVFVRVVFGLHATWLVNSASHMWGAEAFGQRFLWDVEGHGGIVFSLPPCGEKQKSPDWAVSGLSHSVLLGQDSSN
jgi:hypothetical protein